MDTKFHTRMGRLVSYDLDASFTASNQTFSNTQVLDTVGEGVRVGSLTVVDTSTGTVKIVSNELELVGDGAAFSATGLVGAAITKSLGKTMFVTHGADNNVNSLIGFDDASTLGITFDQYYLKRASTVYTFVTSGGFNANVADIVNTQDYQLLFLLGGYDSNGIAFKSGDTEADFNYGMRPFIKGGTFATWTLLATSVKKNTATIYPQFNLHTTNKSTLDNILIPTNPLSVDTMFQPNFLDTFAGTNDDNLGGHVPGVIAGVDGVQTLGTALVDDDCSADNTGDWTSLDSTLAFDTDHYEITYVSASQYTYQAITPTQGTTYKLSLKIKDGTLSSEQILMGIGSDVSSGSWVDTATTYVTSATWQTITQYMTAESGTDAFSIRTNMTGAGNIEIKDILLEPVTNGWQPYANTWTIQSNTANNDPGLGSEAITAQNDRDFSAGNIGNWTLTTNGTGTLAYDTTAIGGDNKQALLTATGDESYLYADLATADVPLSAQTTYKVTANVYIPSGNTQQEIYFRTANIGTDMISSHSPTLNTLEEIGFYFMTGVDVTGTIRIGALDTLAVGDKFYYDDVSVKPVTLNEQFATDDLSLTQGIFDVDVTIPTTADGMAGLVLCLDSESSPANFITAYYNRATGKVECWKNVAGTYTNLFQTTATYAAGANLRAIVDAVETTDFTTYTETDGAGKVTVAATQITLTNGDRDEDYYVTKDFGTDYFGDFTHWVDVNVTNLTDDPASAFVCWGMADSAADFNAIDIAGGSALILFASRSITDTFWKLNLYDLTTGTLTILDSSINIAVNTEIYLGITRSGTTITVTISSTSALRDAGTANLGTITGTCNNTTFSHVYGIGSHNYGATGKDISGTVSNLDLGDGIIDHTKLKVYYNGALIDSEQTINEGAISNNTRHGIMSVDSSNSLDNFTVHNRTDSNWDAEITKATGNIY